MKKALKDKLIAKYPGVLKKLTPKGLDLLVDKLSTKVTTEDEIEDFVNGLENIIEPFVDAMQSETDRRIKEEVDKKKDPEKKDEPTKEENQNKDSEMPAWAKGLQETVTTLQAQLVSEKNKNAKQTFVELAKAKGIPEKIALMYTPAEGSDNETALSELETIWAESKQADINSAIGDGRTKIGVQDKGSAKEATEAEVDSVVDSII